MHANTCGGLSHVEVFLSPRTKAAQIQQKASLRNFGRRAEAPEDENTQA
jgi:hypothetical protein